MDGDFCDVGITVPDIGLFQQIQKIDRFAYKIIQAGRWVALPFISHGKTFMFRMCKTSCFFGNVRNTR